MFGRGRRKARAEAAQLDLLLARTIAAHTPGATVHGSIVDLGLGGLRVMCQVDGIGDFGSGERSARLFLHLTGGPLGDARIFASISGYADDPEGAVAEGGSVWAHSFGPMLRTAFTDGPPGPGAPADGDVTDTVVALDGRSYRLVVSGVDRAWALDDGDPMAAVRELRHRLGGDPRLTPAVLQHPAFPVLRGDRPVVVSVFEMQAGTSRTREVKVNGTDWGPLCLARLPAAPLSCDGLVLLRELAVLTPLEPARARPALTLDQVKDGLTALARRDAAGQAAGWQGWDRHRGRLGPALTADELAAVRASVGPLPPDYADFLATVAGPGAGPGYGLLPPQRFGDVVPLAHAGCGITWILVVAGPLSGTVRSIGGDPERHHGQVAGSFTDWFSDWLEHGAEQDTPWTHWLPTECVTAGAVAQVLRGLAEAPGDPPQTVADRLRSMRILAGSPYLQGAMKGPCQGCVALVAEHGIPPEVFDLGVASGTGADTP